MAVESGIAIEKSEFVRFEEQTDSTGVIIRDANGNESFFACNYAFDCTGAKRALMKAANQIRTPQPFQFKRVVERMPVKMHFIA